MSIEIVIVAVMVVVVPGGALVLILNEPKRKAQRRLRGAVRPISALRVGKNQRAAGRVAGRADLVEDLHGRPCVYARVALMHHHRHNNTDGNISEAWKPAFEEQRGAAFDLCDDSGCVAVDPSSAELLNLDTWYEVDWERLSEREEALIARHPENVWRGRPARWRSTVVRDGDRLTAHGRVTSGPGFDRDEFLAIGRPKD